MRNLKIYLLEPLFVGILSCSLNSPLETLSSVSHSYELTTLKDILKEETPSRVFGSILKFFEEN